ncbi:HAD hydrolase-like protein [Salinicoccus sp. HZC-1]|uniref:HAD hydrolase-like protein n=1 Tax=Salinicoccus sp. HZC-1 TaxID=3385497 RepID=UPI00398A931C
MSKAVIFDMDGTLFQTEIILEYSLRNTLNKLNEQKITYIDNPVEKYNEIMGVPLIEVWRNLLHTPTEENSALANNIFQKSLIDSITSGKSKLYDCVEDALSDIKNKGYDIFVASNGDDEYLKAIYDYYGLDKYIKGVYSINMINSGSKSDLVRQIISKENIKPKYMIGDRLSDFMAGIDNDIETIGCRFYFSKKYELKQASYTVNSLAELKKIIK